MVSRNNRDLYLRKSANKVSKYTIKKLSVGVTSVLVGTAFFLGQATGASAAEQNTDTDKQPEIATQDDSSTNINEQTVKLKAASSTSSTSSTNDDVTTADNTSETAEANENTQTQASASTSTDDATTQTTSSAKEEQNTQVDNSKQEDTVTNESTKESTLSNNDETKTAVSQVNEETAADNSTSTTINNWTGLVNALNSSQYNTINVSGMITAGSSSVYANGRDVVIKGTDSNSGINFGTNPLKLSAKVNVGEFLRCAMDFLIHLVVSVS